MKLLSKKEEALGELDNVVYLPTINLKNVSHNVKEIHWEGDDVVGTVEILPTPSSNILKELLKAKYFIRYFIKRYGFSKTYQWWKS